MSWFSVFRIDTNLQSFGRWHFSSRGVAFLMKSDKTSKNKKFIFIFCSKFVFFTFFCCCFFVVYPNFLLLRSKNRLKIDSAIRNLCRCINREVRFKKRNNSLEWFLRKRKILKANVLPKWKFLAKDTNSCFYFLHVPQEKSLRMCQKCKLFQDRIDFFSVFKFFDIFSTRFHLFFGLSNARITRIQLFLNKFNHFQIGFYLRQKKKIYSFDKQKKRNNKQTKGKRKKQFCFLYFLFLNWIFIKCKLW